MAKSKLIKANETIAREITKRLAKINRTVVDGYIKIEDQFVDQFLTRDGESISDAKKRLERENTERKILKKR